MHMRAVHLEVAHSLEADSFIMALRRFLARRGNPARILSDNSTNFAERELRESVLEIDQKRVADELSARGVQWIFIPPAAPWFGGALAWESLVKSTKRAMKAIMGNVVTVDEVFLTVVAEILGHL
jgi:transposase InsO family protein